MAVEQIESTHYPYLPIDVRIGGQTWRLEALVDTGLDGDVVLPRTVVLAEQPNVYRRWILADGRILEAPVYHGTVRIGGLDPVPADIAVLGEESVVGRGIIERYRVTFDRGERLIVQP